MAAFDSRIWLLSLFLWVLILYPVFAQERPSPKEQAFSSRVLSEINANLTCTTQVIELQDRLAKLEAELAEAKKAKEPTK